MTLASGKLVQDLEDRLVSHIRDAMMGKARDIDVGRLRADLRGSRTVLPEKDPGRSEARPETSAD